MRVKLEPGETAEGLPFVLATRWLPGVKWSAGCSCGFMSSGWESEDIADLRLEQHATEHRSGEAMAELREFEIEHGLVPEPVALDPFGGSLESDVEQSENGELVDRGTVQDEVHD